MLRYNIIEGGVKMYSNNWEILNGALAILGVFAIIIVMLFIAWLVVFLIGKYKLFQKAGKNGWEAIIPFYSTWVLVEISGLAWWWFFIVIASSIVSILGNDNSGLKLIAGLTSLVGSFCCYYNLSKKFHKDTGFAVLTTIFSGIMIPVMGFSSNYQFDSNVVVSEVGPFEKKNTNQTSTDTDSIQDSSKKFCPKCGNPVTEENQFCQNCGTKLKKD